MSKKRLCVLIVLCVALALTLLLAASSASAYTLKTRSGVLAYNTSSPEKAPHIHYYWYWYQASATQVRTTRFKIFVDNDEKPSATGNDIAFTIYEQLPLQHRESIWYWTDPTVTSNTTRDRYPHSVDTGDESSYVNLDHIFHADDGTWHMKSASGQTNAHLTFLAAGRSSYIQKWTDWLGQ